jgi:hypothetical protein
VFVVAFFGFFPSKLPFKFMNSYVNAPVSVFASFGSNENFAMFGSCDYLDAGVTALAAVDNYLDLVDTIIVLWQLGGFFFGIAFKSFGYLNVFATNGKKQNRSP